ncbi:hypothetical protein B0O99DRAFT_705354 [Bisporella sp. PMI_857]|nr:hypothetical protein B0O99DRAFT_705354 [Bisporella sp. PMI_857]
MGLRSFYSLGTIILALASITIQSPLQWRSPRELKQPNGIMGGDKSRIDQDPVHAGISASIPVPFLQLIESGRRGTINRRIQKHEPTLTTINDCVRAACLSTSPTATSTAATSVPTKVDPKCDVAGYPAEYYRQRLWGSTATPDVLACQLGCMYRTPCQSYSFRQSSQPNDNVTNCDFYAATFDERNMFVKKDASSPYRFSDKYPMDGSNYCYGDHQL